MQTTIVRWNTASTPSFPQPVAATLGNFDGVHRGHQELIRLAIEHGSRHSLRPVVISFYPHPATVLLRVAPLPKLSSLRQRVRLLSSLGIEQLLLIRFTRQLSERTPERFLRQLFASNVRHLVIGPYARIGKGRAGTPERISQIFSSLGGSVTIAEGVLASNRERYSSSKIRADLASGDLRGVKEALGRSYAVEGHVVHGDERGRTIGYPTANLVPGAMQLPPRGVYASYVTYGGRRYRAMTNVGMRPTVDDSGRLKIETHLFGFSDSLYHEIISVTFEKKLRDERKFSSIDALTAQLALDAEEAKRSLPETDPDL